MQAIAEKLGSKWIKIYSESATSKHSQWKPACGDTPAVPLGGPLGCF